LTRTDVRRCDRHLPHTTFCSFTIVFLMVSKGVRPAPGPRPRRRRPDFGDEAGRPPFAVRRVLLIFHCFSKGFGEGVAGPGTSPAPPPAGPRGGGGSGGNPLFLQRFSMGSEGSAADPGAGRRGPPGARRLPSAGFCSFPNGFSRVLERVLPVPGARRAAARRRVQKTNEFPRFLKRPPPRADAVQGACHLQSAERLSLAQAHCIYVLPRQR